MSGVNDEILKRERSGGRPKGGPSPRRGRERRAARIVGAANTSAAVFAAHPEGARPCAGVGEATGRDGPPAVDQRARRGTPSAANRETLEH